MEKFSVSAVMKHATLGTVFDSTWSVDDAIEYVNNRMKTLGVTEYLIEVCDDVETKKPTNESHMWPDA